MPKCLELAIAWLVAGLLLVGACSGLAIVQVAVSLKYETTANECISQVTHYNLCAQLHTAQLVCAGSLLLALAVTLAAWLRRSS